jgi:tetratricopeptide (TPR) repeat protein
MKMVTDAPARLDLLLGLRRFREAEALARECLAAEPESATGHVQLARALVGQDRAAEALESARAAAALSPDNPWALAALAWVLNLSDRPGEAIEVLNDVLRLAPHYSWGHELLAAAYAQLGRSGDRLAAARKAVELAPEDESSWVHLSWALHAVRQYQEAIGAADAGLRHHAESAPLHHLRGSCLLAQAESARSLWPFRLFRMAHVSLKEALRLNPGNAVYANDVLVNVVTWRQVAYRMGLEAGLIILFVAGYPLGYLFVGHLMFVILLLAAVAVYVLRDSLFHLPDYGMALLPLGWAGLPNIPMTPEDRVLARTDWWKWLWNFAVNLASPFIGIAVVFAALAVLGLFIRLLLGSDTSVPR